MISNYEQGQDKSLTYHCDQHRERHHHHREEEILADQWQTYRRRWNDLSEEQEEHCQCDEDGYA